MEAYNKRRKGQQSQQKVPCLEMNRRSSHTGKNSIPSQLSLVLDVANLDIEQQTAIATSVSRTTNQRSQSLLALPVISLAARALIAVINPSWLRKEKTPGRTSRRKTSCISKLNSQSMNKNTLTKQLPHSMALNYP